MTQDKLVYPSEIESYLKDGAAYTMFSFHVLFMPHSECLVSLAQDILTKNLF